MAAREQRQTWVDVAHYWVITQEVVNCKYKAMIELLQQQSLDNVLYLNCGANARYSSTVIFNELIECFTGSGEQQLKTDLYQSAFIGIDIDESTDQATEKHLALIARYVSRDAV